MLSFFSNIKRIIRERLNHNIIKRPKRYQVVVMESEIINIDDIDESENSSSPSPSPSPPPSPPPPSPPQIASPAKMHTFFNTVIEDALIKTDYEFQTLIHTLQRHHIDITNIILEPRFEELLQNIPEMSDILKIKMRMIYIIIALDLFWNLFEEKKKYRTLKTKHLLGVFRYNDYIIRIDDSPYSFLNEKDAINALSMKYGSSCVNNIILPFLVYTNVKRDIKNDICDCTTPICECKYTDNADDDPKMTELTHEGRAYYHTLREKTISFSMQRYVKNTEQLYHWVKDNIGNYVYNQFSNIQYPFFIDLFHKCALLLRDLHAVDVVHGDIKPDNILLCEGDDFNLNNEKKCKNFTVHLIDFGLSGIKNDGCGTGGTIPYCHPELKNIRDTNRSSKYNWKKQQLKHDVWSLGIIFITLYIYRDFYNYYHKYPPYFFTKDGYVSSLILDVISNRKLHNLFTQILSHDGISIHEVCDILHEMTNQ